MRHLERFLASLTRRRWRTYRDYLRSAVWRSKRRRALSRAGGACQVCNRRARLEVHHREYPARWGDEPDDDLTVLCSACHDLFHARRAKELSRQR